MSTVKFTGKSEDDAVRKAAQVLSIDEGDVKYKIVSRTGGLLGLLGQTVTIEVMVGDRGREPEPAEVRPARQEPPPLPPARPVRHAEPREQPETMVWRETEEEDDEGAPALPDDQARPEGDGGEGRRQEEPDRPRRDRERHGRGRDSSRRGRDRGPRRQQSQPREDGPRPSGQQRPQHAEQDGEDEMESVVVDEEVYARKTEQAVQLVREMVRLMGGEADVQATRKDAEIHIPIIGRLPEWVGRGHSRSMDALQFLANKIVNRFPPRYRVVLLPEGQRDERLQHIEDAARELAQKVSESGCSAWLVPMNPRERRIVHMAVASFPDLATRSVGDGAGRRLCIFRKAE